MEDEEKLKIESIQDLLSLDLQKELTSSMFKELFGSIENEKPLFEYDTPIRINIKGKTVSTSIGKYVFNKFVIPKNIYEDYFTNETLVKGKFYDFNSSISSAKNFKKEITNEDFASYVDRINWLSSQVMALNGGGITSDSATITDKAKNQIKKLAKQVNKSTSNEDMTKISKEVNTILEGELQGTDLGDIIVNSAAKGNVSNNYNAMFGIRSKEIPNSLEDMTFDDFSTTNSLAGSYGRSVETQVGGYMGKLFINGYSHTRINSKDCHTSQGLETKIDDLKQYYYRYVKLINSQKQFVLLDESNFEEFKNKTVTMRSPMFCKDRNGYCEKCCGEMYKINKIKSNLSIYPSELASTIMLKSMKGFHDTEVKYVAYNFKQLINNLK